MQSTLPTDRLLLAAGPDIRSFTVRKYAGAGMIGRTLLVFSTAGVNGKTALETAVANLSDLSEHTDEPIALHGTVRRQRHVQLAVARYGAVEMLSR